MRKMLTTVGDSEHSDSLLFTQLQTLTKQQSTLPTKELRDAIMEETRIRVGNEALFFFLRRRGVNLHASFCNVNIMTCSTLPSPDFLVFVSKEIGYREGPLRTITKVLKDDTLLGGFLYFFKDSKVDLSVIRRIREIDSNSVAPFKRGMRGYYDNVCTRRMNLILEKLVGVC